MTKKELKDIILKTLEKEGGAAGLKALTKASKTSKGKLKKSLAKMTGVKQHQDGDYISTPINEEETDPPPQAPPFCHYCYKQGCACNRSRGCVNGVGDMSGCGQNPPDFVPTGISNDTWNSSGVYVTISYKKPDKKLREVKEQIFEMITEKLCKKGKAYIAKRKRAGEKSSAYLSGRAVKVCKGQMKG